MSSKKPSARAEGSKSQPGGGAQAFFALRRLAEDSSVVTISLAIFAATFDDASRGFISSTATFVRTAAEEAVERIRHD